MEERLERIEQVTSNYFFWQGLRLVPMGIALILMAFVMESRTTLGAFRYVLTIGILGGALWTSSALGGYYKRAFGSVRGIPGQHSRRDMLKWTVVYPLLIASFMIDRLWQGPLLISGLAWGAATVAYWWSTGRGRPHYHAVALLFAATTFLPVVTSIHRGTPMLTMFIGIVGAAYIVAGLLDHLELSRLMHAEGSDAGSV